MTRPMAVNSSEYLEFLKYKTQYKCLYPYMEWAFDILGSLEEKVPQEYFTATDLFKFEKAKAIIRFVNREIKEETRENHTTTHYIWRTQGDDKVRSNHAKFNGKVFSWGNPPDGRFHPGEDYNCRCWAEAFDPENDESRIEFSSHVISGANSDNFKVWNTLHYTYHYRHGNGRNVTLHETGQLQNVIDYADSYNQQAVEPFLKDLHVISLLKRASSAKEDLL